jgi:hypothetical protein
MFIDGWISLEYKVIVYNLIVSMDQCHTSMSINSRQIKS